MAGAKKLRKKTHFFLKLSTRARFQDLFYNKKWLNRNCQKSPIDEFWPDFDILAPLQPKDQYLGKFF